MKFENPKIYFNHFNNTEFSRPELTKLRERVIIDPDNQYWFWAFTHKTIFPCLCVYNKVDKTFKIYSDNLEEEMVNLNYQGSYESTYIFFAEIFRNSNIVLNLDITTRQFNFLNVHNGNFEYFPLTDVEEEGLWNYILKNYDFEYSFVSKNNPYKSILIKKENNKFEISTYDHTHYGVRSTDKHLSLEQCYHHDIVTKSFVLYKQNQKITNQYYGYIIHLFNLLLKSSDEQLDEHYDIIHQDIINDVPLIEWSILK